MVTEYLLTRYCLIVASGEHTRAKIRGMLVLTRADPMMLIRVMEWGAVDVLLGLVEADDAWVVHAAADALAMILQGNTDPTTRLILESGGLNLLCGAAAATTQQRGRHGVYAECYGSMRSVMVSCRLERILSCTRASTRIDGE